MAGFLKRAILIAAMCFALAPQASALTVVQHVLAKQGTGTPSSLSVTVSATGAGNLVVAAVTTFNSPAHNPTGVTDGTTGFTQFTGARMIGTGTFAGVVDDVYYLPSSNAGKTSITLNVGTATTFLEIEVWEVSGWTSTITEDGSQNLGTGGGTCVATDCTGQPITTTGASGFIVAHNGTNAGATVQNPKTGNAFTSGGDASGDGFVSLITTSTGTYTPVWTTNTSGDQFVSETTAFKDGGGGGGGGSCTGSRTMLTGAGCDIEEERE